MKIAIIGSVGLPARYGGFETFAENLVEQNEDQNISYVVYCSSKAYKERPKNYKGARLKYVGLSAHGWQSIPYDIISIIRAAASEDILFILGYSGCVILPLIRLFTRKPIIVHIDGLEHTRDKWKGWVRRFHRMSERMSVRWADRIVADNKGIQDYVTQEYGIESTLIEYGGESTTTEYPPVDEILSRYGVAPKGYSLAICRIEPENSVETILTAFEKSGERILFIGNWMNGEFGREMKERFGNVPNITLSPPEYDRGVLDILRTNCKFYIHGHRAGGTNPSLVEAMHFGVPVIAMDVVFNRETTEGRATYFSDSSELEKIITQGVDPSLGDGMLEIAKRRYTWPIVTQKMNECYYKVLSERK